MRAFGGPALTLSLPASSSVHASFENGYSSARADLLHSDGTLAGVDHRQRNASRDRDRPSPPILATSPEPNGHRPTPQTEVRHNLQEMGTLAAHHLTESA